jgi:hypothetical protein
MSDSPGASQQTVKLASDLLWNVPPARASDAVQSRHQSLKQRNDGPRHGTRLALAKEGAATRRIDQNVLLNTLNVLPCS